MNKVDYIKQLKRLIKKYHPDLCNDSCLESMYSEITLLNRLYKSYENMVFEENKIIENGKYMKEMGLKML